MKKTNNKSTYTLEQLTQISLQIITFSGTAKSDAMEAIYAAKKGNFELAKERIEKANQSLIEAEKQHMELIQKEAAGVEIRVPLILMHSEDQMLSTQSIIILAEEIVDLYTRLPKAALKPKK